MPLGTFTTCYNPCCEMLSCLVFNCFNFFLFIGLLSSASIPNLKAVYNPGDTITCEADKDATQPVTFSWMVNSNFISGADLVIPSSFVNSGTITATCTATQTKNSRSQTRTTSIAFQVSKWSFIFTLPSFDVVVIHKGTEKFRVILQKVVVLEEANVKKWIPQKNYFSRPILLLKHMGQ